jgi:spore germination protein YaaH
LKISDSPYHWFNMNGSRLFRSFGCLIGLVLLLVGSVNSQPVSVHEADLVRHRDSPTPAFLIGEGGLPDRLFRGAAKVAQPQRVVFGYLPYWISESYYDDIDYRLLTHLAAFSVEVNGNGSLGDDHGWPWTALVNTAHRHGVRVILTATLFGDADVKTLIESSTNRQRFFRAIRDKIREGNADGVNVDFEGPGVNGWPALAPAFLRELTDYLHQQIPDSEVSFASPAVDWSARWDFADIAASCDYLFVMGYAFSGSWSGNSGPTAPLLGGYRNLTTTITDPRDYGDVTRDNPQKLILGVPYYGCRWTTMNDQPGAPATEFGGYPYLGVTLQASPVYGRRWDASSQTSWYRYFESGRWIQVWFDDAESLGHKYDLALSHDLRGVGMWALGYEADRQEPWSQLERLIGRSVPTAIQGDAQDEAAAEEAIEVELGFPNPFNASTNISYHLPGAAVLEAELFDAVGQRLRSWRREHQAGGHFQLHWDGTNESGANLASGIYLMRMNFSTASEHGEAVTRRIALLR